METVLIRWCPQQDSEDYACSPADDSPTERPASLPENASLPMAFWAGAKRAAQPALIAGGQSVSYGALRTAAWNVQRYLRSRDDFRPGSLVALRLENSPEYLVAFYGVLMADGVVVPLPPAIEPARWQQICRACRPTVVISRSQDITHSTVPDSVTTLDVRHSPLPSGVFPVTQRGGQDLAVILYTAGSTGTPKGVMLSHRNLLANAQSILDYLPIRRDDRALVVLPFYHAFGNSILQTHALIGATLVLGESLTFPISILQALQKHQATSFSAVPEVFAMLLRFARLAETPLPSLRYMSVAGGALQPDLALQIARSIAPAQFYVMYGQTEATARLAYLPPAELTQRWGSIGGPIPGVELRVVDDRGDPVAAGSIGRLQARGENVMLGYWQDPKATASLLQGGWLDTGDLATADEDGYLYLRGRSSLLVKIQGHRVHPVEVEEAVARHLPGAQVVVMPYQPDGATRLALFLVPAGGVPVSEREIRRICARELPRHKIPSQIEVLDHWPLNEARKVDRGALVKRLTDHRRKAS